MTPLSLAQVALACGGVVRGGPAAAEVMVTGVAIDSRGVAPGDLFVPLRGDRVDGADYVAAAYQRGAVACLSQVELVSPTVSSVKNSTPGSGLPALSSVADVTASPPSSALAARPQTPPSFSPNLRWGTLAEARPYVLVESCVQGLKDLAEYYRAMFDLPVVAVTGSAGKTTTKDMIAAVLGTTLTVLKTAGNRNNEIGLPLTVFELRHDHDVAVLEMGMNHFGEIHALSRIARPDVAVLTNIGLAHIEHLGSRQAILAAKSEVFDFMAPGGRVFVNGDDDLLAGLAPAGLRLTTFGLGRSNDVRADRVVDRGLDGSDLDIRFGDGDTLSLHLATPGRPMIANALAAAAVGHDFGLSDQQIVQGMADYAPAGQRLAIVRLDRLTLIDDSYNANPVAMAAALTVLASATGRRVAILGDMLELGETAVAQHQQIGRQAANLGLDLIMCAGRLAHNYAVGAAGGVGDVVVFPDQADMLRHLGDWIKDGDTVLVKASHGMAFQPTVEWLTRRGTAD